MSYDELDQTQDIYFLVSGGRDSTAMVLLAYEQGIKGTLLFGDTRLSLSSAKDSLSKLEIYTNYPLITARYEGNESPIKIIKKSFMKIPQCIGHLKDTDVFRRNMFQCCHELKHEPMRLLQKELGDNAVFVMGIKNESPIHRLYRMRQLRELNTFYRKHKANGFLYYYPLRDWTEEQVTDKLQEHGFDNTHSSGCSICPIFCIFESWKDKDPDTWRRSVQFADRLGIKHPAAGQQFLTKCGEFIE